jgi:hypothetical protein
LTEERDVTGKFVRIVDGSDRVEPEYIGDGVAVTLMPWTEQGERDALAKGYKKHWRRHAMVIPKRCRLPKLAMSDLCLTLEAAEVAPLRVLIYRID